MIFCEKHTSVNSLSASGHGFFADKTEKKPHSKMWFHVISGYFSFLLRTISFWLIYRKGFVMRKTD